MTGILQRLSRKKFVSDDAEGTALHRCLSVWQLTLMGVGGMVGSGIYFLVGRAAKEQAGPAIVISFLLACVVVVLSAICYTEFATRVSKTGSIYLYMYMTLGEFVAFIAGWSALLSTVSGGATNGRTWSAYFDSLFSNRISNYTQQHIADWSSIGEPLAQYPDFVAAAVILTMTAIVASGANFSAKFNAFFAGFNICILVFCCIVGFIYGDVTNWTNPETGGYFPFGWSGVVKGAASCFWAFTGFEILATSVEEAKNPKRSIPLSIGFSMAITTVLYISTAASLTFVTSYQDLDVTAPLPSAFSSSGLSWARYIVSIGPLCGLTTTLFSAQYAFVRITYAMALDGLLFPFCHAVNGCTKTPVWTTLTGGVIMAVIACFMDVSHIIDFGIIVNLLQYALVSACVIILRYRPDKSKNYVPASLPSDEDLNAPKNQPSPYHWKLAKFRETSIAANGLSESMNNLLDNDDTDNDDVIHRHRPEVSGEPSANGAGGGGGGGVRNESPPSPLPHVEQWESVSQTSVDAVDELLYVDSHAGTLKPQFHCLKRYLRTCPTQPGACVFLSVILISVAVTLLSVIIVFGEQTMEKTSGWWLYVLLALLTALTSLLLFVIFAHRQSIFPLSLKVPCLPWLPATSLFLCVLLMISAAGPSNWLVFLVVTTLGVLVYFSYGLHHSTLNAPRHVTHARTTEDAVALLDILDANTDDDS